MVHPLFAKILRLMGGMGIYSLSQWLMISILAHLSGPTPVGIFSLAQAITVPLSLFCALASHTLLQTEVGRSERPFKDYWHLRLVTNIPFLLLMLGIILWRRDSFDTAVVIALVALLKAVESLSDICCGLAQRKGNNNIYGHSLALRGIFGFACFGSIYWTTRSLPLAVIGVGLASLCVLAFHDWTSTRRWHGTFSPLDAASIRAIARKSFPLGFGVSIAGFNIAVPRLVLEHTDGVEVLGVFAAIAYLLSLGNLAVSAMGNTMLTRLSEFWNASDVRSFTLSIAKGTAILAVLCGIGIVAAWLLGEQILRLLYGSAFARNSDLLVLVAFAGTLVMISSFWSYALLSTQNFFFQLWLNIATLVVVCSASFLLIPRYGAFGAAYALVALGLARSFASILNYAYAVRKKTAFAPITTGIGAAD